MLSNLDNKKCLTMFAYSCLDEDLVTPSTGIDASFIWKVRFATYYSIINFTIEDAW